MLESLTRLTFEHALCLTHSPPPLACHPLRLYNAPSLMPAFLWGTGSEGPGQERSTRAEGVFTSLHHPVVCRDKAYNCLVFFGGGGAHPQHMEVPRLEVKSELQLPAYASATAMQDPGHIFSLTTAHGNTVSLTQ